MPATTPILGLPYPTADDTVDVPRDVQALAAAIDPLGTVPVGAMTMWPSGVSPSGWLLCQGQQVDAATYPKLDAVLGSSAGKITLPDMRDVFPVGAGATMPLGQRGGAAAVALSVAQLPSHNHTGLTGARDRSQSHAHSINGLWMAAEVPGMAYPPGGSGITPSPITVAANDAPDHLHTIPAQGGNGAHENRPPYAALNFIIRAA
jgi:microcystin-dependent protein